MAKICEYLEVKFCGEGDKSLIVTDSNFPEDETQKICAWTLRLNGVDYRPVFYWNEHVLHLALLREDIYIQSIHGEREITLDDWSMTMMLDRDKHFKPTTTRSTSFQGIEITSLIKLID